MKRNNTFSFLVALLLVMARTMTASAQSSTVKRVGILFDPQNYPPPTSDKTYPPRLLGTVVDASEAVISGATVQIRSANGAVLRTTQTERNGSSAISGFPAGSYRLVVSNPDFETKKIPVTIATTGAPVPLRIPLAVGSVSASIDVQGREDDLIVIAESATQGTVSAKEIQDRPIFRSEEIFETIPGVIITKHAGGC